MSRKLLFLDLVLLAVMILAGVQFRKQWKAVKTRDDAARASARETSGRAAAAAHHAGASRHAFAVRGRGAEGPVPSVAQSEHSGGSAALRRRRPASAAAPARVSRHDEYSAAVPIAMMSVNSGAAHQAIRIGENIGQYRLKDVTTDGITLEWNGQIFEKKTEELSDHSKDAPAEQAQAAPANGNRTVNAPPPQAAPVSR